MPLAPTAITTTQAPPPQAAPRAAAPATEQAAFAKVLAARQHEAKAADARQAQAAEARAQQSRQREAARDSGSTSRGGAGTSADPVTQPSDEADGAAAVSPPDAAAAKPPAPTLAELLAALNRPQPDNAGEAADGAAIGAASPTTRGTRAAAALAPGGRHAAEPQPGLDIAQAEAEKAQAAAAEAIASGADKDLARPEARGEAAQAAPATLTAPLSALHAAPRTEAAAATQAVTLSTPATAPEFREALGVQVSVLARGGVQQAELHLNPAEMGPISVQIALEGTQAQVQFGVDSTATRQLIEAGLPELAAALRDAGFTLSGGGVSQHSRGQAEGAAPDHGAAGAPAGDEGDMLHAAAAASHGGWRLPQGAVDLYA